MCNHIIKLFATYEDSHSLYLVTELAGGGDLFHYLAGREKLAEADVATVGTIPISMPCSLMPYISILL